MNFRLVLKSVILNDLERRDGRYICVISQNLVNLRCRKRSVAEFMQVYCIVRVQFRRKESSRSLFHLLMSFLSTLSLTVFTQRNFVADFLQAKSYFILKSAVLRF